MLTILVFQTFTSTAVWKFSFVDFLATTQQDRWYSWNIFFSCAFAVLAVLLPVNFWHHSLFAFEGHFPKCKDTKSCSGHRKVSFLNIEHYEAKNTPANCECVHYLPARDTFPSARTPNHVRDTQLCNSSSVVSFLRMLSGSNFNDTQDISAIAKTLNKYYW